MPRFTAEHDDTNLIVTDTASANVVLGMPWADLHAPGSGATADVAISEPIEVDRAFGTPYGDQREMGFDILFTVTNTSGSDRQIGAFRLKGFNLVPGVNVLSPLGDSFAFVPTGANHKLHPGDLYSPLVVLRDYTGADYPYNVSVALAYPAVEYDHPLHIQWPAASTGAVPSEVRFDCGYGNTPDWATMPVGTTRRYRLMFRINDLTNTNVGTAADAPQEWLWTLRGYQQYFRSLYGRPDYRRMGGWDGRVIASINTSGGTYNATTNPRSFGTGTNGNPSTVGTGGERDGYYKFASRAEAMRARNVKRQLVWALSGFVAPGGGSNYDPRFATGVETMPTDVGTSVGPDTVKGGLREIRDRMQMGLYWGECCKVPESNTWTNGTRHEFDPTDPSDVTRMLEETDLAVQHWNAQVIGLDAYALAAKYPGRSVRWLRFMQQRYSNVLFITEAELPDFVHVIAPTYRTEDPNGSVQSAAWVAQYINPGGEYVMQTNDPTGQSANADRFCSLGYTPIGGWSVALTQRTRALQRWNEVGERAIPHFDSSRSRTISQF